MRQSTGRKLCRFAAVLILVGWMAVIFSFSAQPAQESSRLSEIVAYRVAELFGVGMPEADLLQLAARLDHPIRKMAHMMEYAILGILFISALCGERLNGWRAYLWAFVLAVCYAVTDELHQILVPGRSGQASDVCVDAIGVILGLLVLFFVQKMRRRHCEMRRHPVK